MSATTIPTVVGGSLKAHWLDVECPACKHVNRIGVSCPQEGKPCWSCSHVIDFWAAWRREDLREADEQTIRDYWADQGVF